MGSFKGGAVEGSSYYEVSVCLNRHAAQLYSVVAQNSEDFISLSVRRRGDSDFVAVLKRLGPDGAPEIAFGNGNDCVTCLLGLSGAVAAGRWKVDVPYEERAARKVKK